MSLRIGDDGLVRVAPDGMTVGALDRKSALAGAALGAVTATAIASTVLVVSRDTKHATRPADPVDPPPGGSPPPAAVVKAIQGDTPWLIAGRYHAQRRRNWWQEMRDANPQKATTPNGKGWKVLLVGDTIVVPPAWQAPTVTASVGHMVDGRWHTETIPGPFTVFDESGFPIGQQGAHRHPLGTDYAEVSGLTYLPGARVAGALDDVGAAASVGDRVEALYTDGSWYPATVTSVESPGHFIVAWDDGDTTGTHVTATRPIGGELSARDAAVADCARKGGELSEAGCMVDGKIVEITRPPVAPAVPRIVPASSGAPVDRSLVGQRVEAQYGQNGEWYGGILQKADLNDPGAIKWDPGTLPASVNPRTGTSPASAVRPSGGRAPAASSSAASRAPASSAASSAHSPPPAPPPASAADKAFGVAAVLAFIGAGVAGAIAIKDTLKGKRR